MEMAFFLFLRRLHTPISYQHACAGFIGEKSRSEYGHRLTEAFWKYFPACLFLHGGKVLFVTFVARMYPLRDGNTKP